MPLTQQCVKRRHNRATITNDPGLESMARNRPQTTRSPVNDTWNDTLRTSSKIADTFCPDGYARPRMRATRLPSNLKAPRSSHLSLSLDDTVLLGRRLTVRFVSFTAPKSLVAYTARFHKLILMRIGYEKLDFSIEIFSNVSLISINCRPS